MNKLVIYILIFSLLVWEGCSRGIYNAADNKREIASYDTATFNFVYGESIRQKLMGNAGEALKYLEQCIKINPRSDAVYNQIAQISLQHGDLENGRIYAKKAYSLDKNNLWYITMLGDIYYQEKNLDSSSVYYEKAVRQFPEKVELKVRLAGILTEKSEFLKADQLYSYLENKYGKGGNFTLLGIRNMISSGRFDEAEEKTMKVLMERPDDLIFNGLIAEIYKAKGEKEKAEETYKKLLRIDSTNIQTIISLMDFYYETKKFDAFFGLVNDLVIDKRLPRDAFLTLFDKILDYQDILKSRGVELEILIRVLENNFADDSLLVMIRPEVYRKEGKYTLAAERYEELIRKYPENYGMWERLLLLYSDTHNYDRLFVLGKECATKFNMSYIAKVLYASAAMEKKQYDIAIEELEKAKILAGNQDEMITQVLSMEADVYYRKKEYLKSFELYRDVLKKNPEDMIVLNNYAYFLAEQNKDLKEAERMIRIVMNKEKDNGTFTDTFAWVLYKRGKFKEAAKIMEDLLNVNKTEDAEWFEHYGYIMKAVKKYDVAVNYWQRALKLNSEKEYLKDEIRNCSK